MALYCRHMQQQKKPQSHLNQKRSVQFTDANNKIQTKVSLLAALLCASTTYYSVCTLYANYNQDIKFPYIIKIYCFKGLDSVSTAITSPVIQKSVWPAKLQYAIRAKL